MRPLRFLNKKGILLFLIVMMGITINGCFIKNQEEQVVKKQSYEKEKAEMPYIITLWNSSELPYDGTGIKKPEWGETFFSGHSDSESGRL